MDVRIGFVIYSYAYDSFDSGVSDARDLLVLSNMLGRYITATTTRVGHQLFGKLIANYVTRLVV